MTIPTSRLACWFSADAGTFQDVALSIPAAADGDPVGGWADQSGNGFKATQSVAASRPVLKMNQINGLPTLRFNSAASQFLSLGKVLGKPRAWSIFVVMMTTNPNQRQSPHGSVDAAGMTARSWGNSVISQAGFPLGSAAPDFGDGSNYSLNNSVGGLWVANTFALMSYVHRDNDAAVSIFKNGVEQATTQAVAGTTQCIGTAYNFSLGREGDVPGIYLSGDIAEFLLYDTSLLPVDRKAAESYLKARYGL